jgi:hypothetical protein
MRVFEAEGVVVINGRPAGHVSVSFSAGGRKGPLARTAPPAVLTDKLGRWVQDGFVDGVTYAATASVPGVTFSPPRVPLDVRRHQVRLQGTAATFAASGVARTAPLIATPGKPPGIPGVTVAFMRVAGRADVAVPAPVVTAADGTWTQSGFQVGTTFQAVPSKAGLGFVPASVEIRAGVSSEFTGASNVFVVEGRVATAGGAPERAVTIGFERIAGAGVVPLAVTTDGAGNFIQSGFDRSSRYRVTPRKASETFVPASRDVAIAANSFPGALASFERRTNLVVIGQVLTTAGAGLLSTVIRFDRLVGNGAVPLPVTTTSNGEYRAAGLDTATTYRVTGTRDGFGVTPAQLRATSPGTVTLNLTAFPAFTVTGTVLDAEGGVPADLAQLEAFLAELPPVPGAVVAFHRTDTAAPAPEPVVAAADGTYEQRGFEVGGAFVAEASAPGFVGATLFPLFFGVFGGTTADGGSIPFSHDRADRLDGVLLLLQRAT